MINKLDYITFLNKYKDLVENEDWKRLFEVTWDDNNINPLILVNILMHANIWNNDIEDILFHQLPRFILTDGALNLLTDIFKYIYEYVSKKNDMYSNEYKGKPVMDWWPIVKDTGINLLNYTLNNNMWDYILNVYNDSIQNIAPTGWIDLASEDYNEILRIGKTPKLQNEAIKEASDELYDYTKDWFTRTTRSFLDISRLVKDTGHAFEHLTPGEYALAVEGAWRKLTNEGYGYWTYDYKNNSFPMFDSYSEIEDNFDNVRFIINKEV